MFLSGRAGRSTGRHSVGLRVEAGEGLGENSRAGPEGGSPAYWEASPVTNSLVTQQAVPLPGSQFHLLWGEYGLYLWFYNFFLPSIVKHVFFKLYILSIQHPSLTSLHYLFTLHHRSSYHGRLFSTAALPKSLTWKWFFFPFEKFWGKISITKHTSKKKSELFFELRKNVFRHCQISLMVKNHCSNYTSFTF